MAMWFDLAANPTVKSWKGLQKSIVMKMEYGVAKFQNVEVHPAVKSEKGKHRRVFFLEKEPTISNYYITPTATTNHLMATL